MVLFLHIVLITLIIGVIIFIMARFGPEIVNLTKNPEYFRDWLNSFGRKSAVVFIAFQAMQVVIASIPGEVIQVAGGYVFGTFLGTVLLLTGVILGSFIAFYASRLLGYPLVRMFVSKRNLEKYSFLINGGKLEIIVFILFLIPGMPKDILTYMAGLTSIKPLRFILITTAARFPALFMSAYIGANLKERDYAPVIVISIIAVVLFVAGVLLREKLIKVVQSIIYSEHIRTKLLPVLKSIKRGKGRN